MFTWISLGGRMGRYSVLRSSQIWLFSLFLFLTFIFSPHSLMLFFKFIWSSYIYLGAKGTRVMVLPSFIIVYLFQTSSCIAFLSYCHGLLNKIWLACIGTTSYKISSTYFPIENGTTTCLVIFTSPLLFNHYNLYSLVCLTIHKFSLLTRVMLTILVQLSLSIIKLHTLFWT